jgi:hypothetical protein
MPLNSQDTRIADAVKPLLWILDIKSESEVSGTTLWLRKLRNPVVPWNDITRYAWQLDFRWFVFPAVIDELSEI